MCLYKQYASRYLSNIYPVDLEPPIKQEYSFGQSVEEVWESFVEYRNAMQNAFQMIRDRGYKYFSDEETDRDTILIPLTSVFAVLYITGSCGVLQIDGISINSSIFKERLRKVKRAYINKAIIILEDSGFIFNGNIWGNDKEFSLYYPDNRKVIYGLYSFSKTLDWEIGSTVSASGNACSYVLLNSRLFSKEKHELKPFELYDLLRFVKSEPEKQSIIDFHNKMTEDGYLHTFGIDIFGSNDIFIDTFIRYDFKQYEPRAVVRAYADDNSCGIGVKMKNISAQTALIEACSDDFKRSFIRLWKDCGEDTCGLKKADLKNCKGRVCCLVENNVYVKCTFESWDYIWNQTVFKPYSNDIDMLIYLVKLNEKNQKAGSSGK